MTNNEKIKFLAENVFDVDESEVNPDMILEELDFWDSMSKLSLVSFFDEQFGKVLKGEEIKSFKTIQDILNAMNWK